jgi:hypothetical protein
VNDENVTKAEQVPPHETTPSPVEVSVAMPRYFGITPPTLLFGIATATLAVAIVLAVLAHWVAAIVLAVAVLIEIVMFLGVARRKPDTVFAKASVRGFQRARERAVWLLQSTTVRTEAGRQLNSLRLELMELDERWDKGLRELGAAVYEGDDQAVQRLKEELTALDDERKRTEGEMREIEAAAQERLEEGRLQVQPTVIKPPGEDE